MSDLEDVRTTFLPRQADAEAALVQGDVQPRRSTRARPRIVTPAEVARLHELPADRA